MLLYYFLKVYFKVVYRLYFRKLYTANSHLVPGQKPMLLASNHPNSLLDSVIHTIYFPRVLHVVTRGDVFKKKFLWFFKYTKQIPVFRFRDGHTNLLKNKQSFELCNQKLGEGAAITIFSEGSCVHQKKLRRIQKGTAKMALWALEANQFEPDIMIVPSGINYTYANKYRSRAMVVYDEPIAVKDYMEIYKENPNKAFRQLTQTIQERLEKLVIHINEEKNEPLFEYLAGFLRFDRKESVFPIWSQTDQPRVEEKKLADQVNQFTEVEKEAILKLKADTETIHPKWSSERILTALFRQPRWLFLFLGLPLALIGLVNLPIALAAESITNKRVKNPKFWATVYIAVAMLLSLLVYNLAFILILIFCGFSLCLLYLVLAAVAGIFAIYYRDAFLECMDWFSLKKISPDRLASLKENLKKSRRFIP